MVEVVVRVSRLAAFVIILAATTVAVICVIRCCGRIQGIEVARLPIASQWTTVGIVSHGVGEAECFRHLINRWLLFLLKRQSWLGWIGLGRKARKGCVCDGNFCLIEAVAVCATRNSRKIRGL